MAGRMSSADWKGDTARGARYISDFSTRQYKRQTQKEIHMAAGKKAASLNPADFTSGGAVADGEYVIAAVSTAIFDYGGNGPETPSIAVTYKPDTGEAMEQHYSAGKMESLAPSDDGKTFVHPSGEAASINKSSNAAAWLASLLNSGFPVSKMGEDVTCFVGCRVQIVNQAQPKRAGLKDQVEGKTIPLVTKVLSLPGERKAAGGRQAAPSAAKTSTPPPRQAAAAAPPTSPSNGETDLTELAIAAVQEVLTDAPDHRFATRLKLGTAIMLRLSKVKDPNMPAIKKLASSADFLMENADLGGWVSDGESVELGQ